MSEKQEVPNQIGKMLGQLVEHQQHFSAMPKADREWVIRNTPAAISLFIDAVKNRVGVEAKRLLKFLRPISFPAIATFVVAEKFHKGKYIIDGIRVDWTGPKFKEHFLQKIEKDVPALEAGEYELVAGSPDAPIITELGSEENVETTFAHFWEFLKMNQSGWHIRYIRDVNGVLWAVSGRWFDRGLNVEALSLHTEGDWAAGARFVSR